MFHRRHNVAKRLLLSVGLCLVATLGVVTPSTAHAAQGGPVILGGDDLTDHGHRDTSVTPNVNVEGWLYLERAIENVLPAVTRPGADGSIAAIGSADSSDPSGGDAGAAIHFAALDAGASPVPVTYYEGGPAITQFFNDLAAGTVNPSVIWVSGNGAGNDLSDGDGLEVDALNANATAIADFVNSGGGLISHGTEYGWLGALLPGLTAVDSGSGDLYVTPEFTAAFPGVTVDDVNAGPWHNHFEGDLGGLQVLAAASSVDTAAGADAPVIIGGGAVVLPGSISLDPPTATGPTGSSHTVTATVRDRTGALDEGVTVTFTVLSGPNAGETGTAVTDANGVATFTWVGDGGPGTDTVEARFTDAAGAPHSATATMAWEGATPPSTPPTTPPPPAVAVQVTPTYTG